MLTKIIDGGRKTGIMQEILRAMVGRGSEVARKTKGEIYDPELMKVALLIGSHYTGFIKSVAASVSE